MRRHDVVFGTFKTEYIDRAEGGYYPVWLAQACTDDDDELPAIDLDMICQWRIPDSNVRLLRVFYSSPEERAAVCDYCRTCLGYLTREVANRINCVAAEGVA